MSENDNRKRKSKRAVFENAESNEKIKAILTRDDIDDEVSSSNSELGLIIDDNDQDVSRKQRIKPVRIGKEILDLHCQWDNCTQKFDNYPNFNKHLKNHIYDCDENEETFVCYWKDCDHTSISLAHLNQHLCFHGYHTKLKNIGQNVAERYNLPKCTLDPNQFKIPVLLNGYVCEWYNCNNVSTTIYDFIQHTQIHVKNENITKFELKSNGIKCEWKGCNTNKFTEFCKLSLHIRIHTNEKLIACPTCGNLFHSSTKFCDHRNRQLPKELFSYICSQCSKRYPTERLLRDHMRSHINNYKCSLCDMTCPKPSVLAKHFRYRHLNQKPFKCHLCDFRGVSKHNLDAHLKVHDDKIIKTCDKCNYKCRTEYGLEKHCHKAHGKDWTKIYECHNCKRRFPRGSFLTKHLMKKHNYHWPSGHSRFRYKKDQDNILRLQTVRYETLDVTEEIMKSKTNQNQNQIVKKSCKYSLRRKDNVDSINQIPQFEIKKVDKKTVKEEKEIVITIDDLDAKGNVLKSRTVQSTEIICDDDVDDDDDSDILDDGDDDSDSDEDDDEEDEVNGMDVDVNLKTIDKYDEEVEIEFDET